MNFKRWLLTVAIATLILSSPFLYITLYNYYVDPLWNFGHENKANESQIAFDERQLKVNYLAQTSEQYETLLVGTSRTTYINQHDFTGMNVYNFSAGNLALNEYLPYINYAKDQNGKDFETIILEVFPTGKIEEALLGPYGEPITYIETNESPLYPIKSLFSMDTFEKSQNNASDLVKEGFRIYDRDNVVSMTPIDKEKVRANIDKGIRRVTTITKTIDFTEYKQKITEIKEANPNTTFILYSPPYFYERLLKIFKEEKGIQVYRDWLETCINVFGGIVNFTTINDISLNEENYFDTNHFYPSTGTFIAQDIAAFNNGGSMKFATYVNQENLDEFMLQFEKQLEQYKNK